MDKITIPSTYNGKAVTKILSGAFCDALNLTEIIIPNTIIEIGSYAFDCCSNLKIVDFENVDNWCVVRNMIDSAVLADKALAAEYLLIYSHSTWINCNHIDSNNDWCCDNEACCAVFAPEADSIISIEDALKLGKAYGSYRCSTNKYYISGTVIKIEDNGYSHGMYIVDASGNSFYVDELYDVNGENEYASMTIKPIVGDTVTVYGSIYNSDVNVLMSRGYIVEYIAHTHNYVNAVCDICGMFDPEHSCVDNDGNDECDVCCSRVFMQGVPYKMFMTQVNLGYNIYALNTTQNGENKYIETTLDPNEAAVFYIDTVEAGYKIYTEIDGVKYYLHAELREVDGSKITKYIGFKADSTCVFVYDQELGMFKITLNGTEYGVGTYSLYETISLSEVSYFKADNINVAGGQFPINLMKKEEADALPPSVKPGNNEPEADSTLTIAEAIELGNSKNINIYTENKYYITGIIKEIRNTTYGNFIITDGTNDILIYGTYDATGSTKYGDMDNPPKVGDTVTVYGVIGKYSEPQMKNGWLISSAEHTHTYADGVCDCGAADPMHTCIDNNEDYVCDVGLCGSPIAPKGDSTLTIEQANKLGNVYSNNTYTNSGYYITGVIVSVSDNYYGSMYIQDAEGNELYIYDTYNSDGSVRYSNMTERPIVGDVILVYGRIGNYYGTSRMKDAWILEYTPHSHNYINDVCSICEQMTPEHACVDYVNDYICDVKACGQTMLPNFGSTLTIPQANALGKLYQNDYSNGKYSDGKYYVKGVIKSIESAIYGNIYIQDDEGNTLYISGLYNYNGTESYGNMSMKPVVGDTIVVYGVIGYNEGAVQMKNGWIEIEREDVYEGEVIATFTFGENVTGDSITHVDGSTKLSADGETFTEGSYSLVVAPNSANVYVGANDAMGNSCIKLGTSIKVATFSFTVGADVTQVVIRAAKYKTNNSTLNVNGIDYILGKNSNDGDYDEIIIDTTSNKTISVATVSGASRAMIDAIIFRG